MKQVMLLLTAIGGLAAVGAFAAEEKMQPTVSALKMGEHIMLTEDKLTWGPAPASLPAGAQAAVLEGDPKQQGLFTLRLKLPAGYKIQPHWHPADEHITVVSGTFSMGLGDTFDESKAQALPAGAFAVMAAKTRHYALTKDGATIQLHGMGPWGINYVNPKDDPRKQTSR